MEYPVMTFRLSYITAVLTFFLITAVPSGAQEQVKHTLRGVVIDDDHLPVSGAIVTLLPVARQDTTDDSGAFRFDNVAPGEYTLASSQPMLGLKDARASVTVPMPDKRPVALRMQGRTYDAAEVIVVAKPPEESSAPGETPAMVSVVERKSFEDRAKTVADVIAATPGATIQTMGGAGDYTEVSLRGANAQQVQVYVDGMLLNEAVGGAVNLAAIPLAQARSVEVWRSGAPARFGGGAVGGAVNIRTRDFLSDSRSLSIGYGSFNTLNAQTLAQFPLGGGRLLLTGGYISSDNDFSFRSDNGTSYNHDDDFWTKRHNDGFHSLNLLGKYRVLLGEKYLLELSEQVVSNDKELPGRDIVQGSSASIETTRNLAQARLTLPAFLRGRLETEPVAYYIYTHEHYRDLKGSVGWGTQDNLYRTHSLRFNLPLTMKLGNHGAVTLTPGADHETYSPDYRLQKTIPLSCEREHYSAALDASMHLLRERLLLTGAFSRDRYYSSFEGEPSSQNRTTPKPIFHNLTGSSVGARFAILKQVFLAANYSDAIRVPSFYELFGDRGTTVSNPDLKPERTFRWDTGLKAGRRFGTLDLSLEYSYFSNCNRNLIQWYTNDAGFLFPDNVSGSWVRGTELVWSARLAEHLSCTGNWTAQRSKVTGEKNKIYRGKALPNRPENYGSLRVECPFRGITPYWTLNHKGAYFLDRANQSFKRYPGRTMQDAGAVFPFPRWKTKVALEVRNFTDRHTFDTQGMPLPGRSFSETMTWTL